MKKVLLILCAIAMFSFTSLDYGCPPDSVLISSSCDSTGSCWTIVEGVGFNIRFKAPTIDEEADIRIELESRCSQFNRSNYLSPVPLG